MEHLSLKDAKMMHRQRVTIVMSASLNTNSSQVDQPRCSPLFRKPKRMTITLPETVYHDLVERSDREGRSLSSLAAFLLEYSLKQT